MKNWSIIAPKTVEKLEIDELRFPESAKDMVKVKISKASLASSDVAVFKGLFDWVLPVIPARSAVALVSECPSGVFKKGERVFLSPYSQNDGKIYVRGVECDGFASDYAILNESEAFLLPETITEDEAVFVDDAATAVNVIEKLKIEKSEYVLLFGASALNIIAAQLAIYYQAIPIVIDSNRERLAKAADYDIYYTVNVQEENLKQRVTEITGGHFADHAVCDTDSEFYAENLFGLLKYGGSIVLVGLNKAVGRILSDISNIVKYGLTVLGANNGKGFIASAINLLATGAIKADGLTAREASFDELPEVLESLATEVAYYKTVIKC